MFDRWLVDEGNRRTEALMRHVGIDMGYYERNAGSTL